jgi:signal peptidase I
MSRFKPERDLLKELGSRLLAEGKVLRMRADGYSMYPQIKPGSFLLIEPVSDVSLLQENEIVVLKRSSSMVVHRLVRIEHSAKANIFITRGDSCLREDESIKADQIVGKVVRIVTGDKFDRENTIQMDPVNYKINNMIVKVLLIRDKIRSIFDY